MRSRRRKPGESLQHLFQELCRLKTLALGKTVESEFSKLYLRDVFLDALNNRELRKLILIQEPSTMEEALRIANHLEAIDATGRFDGDRDTSSHYVKKKVHQLDQDVESATVVKDSVVIERQLAEVKQALNDVCQELSRQAALSSVSRTINEEEKPTTRFQNKSEIAANSPIRTRGASARPFVDSARVGPDVCRYCKKPGHWAYDRPVLKRKDTSADTRKKSVPVKTGENIVIDKSDGKSTNVLNSPSKVKNRSEGYLEIRMRTRKMCALLDTGCDHSVIGRSIIPNAELEPTTEKLYTANGSELPLLGEIDLHFRINKTWSLVRVVVSEAVNDLILGID